jgi:EamA domain-containing membrane protein RarD
LGACRKKVLGVRCLGFVFDFALTCFEISAKSVPIFDFTVQNYKEGTLQFSSSLRMGIEKQPPCYPI